MPKVPKYRKHSTRDIGFVEFEKKREYFPGKYNSPESLRAYADFIDRLEKKADTNGHGIPDLRVTRGQRIPIKLLILRYLDYADEKYVKNGRPTGQADIIRLACSVVREMFGEKFVDEFGPLSLEEVQKEFIRTDADLPSRGLCRKEANRRVRLIQQMFGWGVGKELVSREIAGALKYIEMFREGTGKVRESIPVKSVSDAVIDATLPFLPPTVDDMVRVHRLIGGRPQDICNLRWCDIDESDDIWIFTPFEHKMEHKRKVRHIAIRFEAQIIFEQYRHRPVNEFIFSPRETVRIVADRKRAARKTPTKPSQIKREKKKAPRHNEKYSTRAYETAIDRAAAKAGVPPWSPNQLRHAFATETEGSLNREAARILLGHSHQSTTDIYVDENIEKIKEAARAFEKAKGKKPEIDP